MSEVQTNPELDAAFARVDAHAKNLLEGGAPHQQTMANDLKLVTDHAKGITPVSVDDPAYAQEAAAKLSTANAALETANGKIANLQSNIDNLLRVRDDLQAQLEKATADLLAAKAANTELEAKLARGPLSTAADPVGGRWVYDPNTGAMAGDDVHRPLVFDPVTGAVQSVG